MCDLEGGDGMEIVSARDSRSVGGGGGGRVEFVAGGVDGVYFGRGRSGGGEVREEGGGGRR